MVKEAETRVEDATLKIYKGPQQESSCGSPEPKRQRPRPVNFQRPFY